MSKVSQFKYSRVIITFISVLLIFLAIVISAILSQHREMTEEIHHDTQRELELIGNFARESLLVMDYAAVEQFLMQWAGEHNEILELKAVAPNGFVLVDFKRDSDSKLSFDLKQDVIFNGRKLVFLKMKKDMSPAQASMVKFSLPLILGSIFLVAIIGIVLWYSMRKLALIPLEKELELREQAEKKFRMLLESAPDSMILVDTRGKIIMVNGQTEVVFGFSRDELEGRNIDILIPERFHDKHRGDMSEYALHPMARSMGVDLELYGLKRDGKEFPADISLSPIETEEGLFILSAIRDVSERKLAENKIKRSYDFQTAVSAILRIALEPISLKEQLHLILDTILNIPGLSLESMGCIYLVEGDPSTLVLGAQRGMPESTIRSCAAVPFGHCLCGKAASSKKIIFDECDISKGDHAEYAQNFPHSHYCVPIVSGSKTLGVINLVVKKGHKRSPDEEDLLTSVANSLAGIIEHERTEAERMELQSQLAHVEKLSALGRLTANVAHEIRTPLTLIGGFTRRLRKKMAEGTKDQEYSDIIITEVDRLENILKGILTYSSQPHLNLTKIDMNVIIGETVKAFQERCRRKAVAFNENLGDIPAISVDQDQVRGIFNNLFSNAIDSMPDGGAMTVVTEKSSVEDTDYIVVRITDTGGGIPEDKIEMIFEPFYSTKILGKGTGLGLSISKKVMEDHGGNIKVESSLGRGTTFSLFFPINGK